MRLARVSTVLAIILANGGVCLANDPGRPEDAPPPKTAIPADCEAVFLFREGQWYQSRLTLSVMGPRKLEGEDKWNFYCRSELSVRRYNPESGDYDILVHKGSPNADQSFRFFYRKDKTDDALYLTASGSSGGGGDGGVPETGMTRLIMSFEPERGLSGVRKIEEGLDFSISATLTIEPTQEQKEEGMEDIVVKVTRRWNATVKPDRSVEFVDLPE